MYILLYNFLLSSREFNENQRFSLNSTLDANLKDFVLQIS